MEKRLENSRLDGRRLVVRKGVPRTAAAEFDRSHFFICYCCRADKLVKESTCCAFTFRTYYYLKIRTLKLGRRAILILAFSTMAEHQPDISSNILIHTQCPTELVSFKWRVTNFSKIFNEVKASFCTAQNVTRWELTLSDFGCDSYSVMLKNLEMSEVDRIQIAYQCSVKTKYFEEKSESHMEYYRYEYDNERQKKLISFPKTKYVNKIIYPLEFENDTFELQCDLTISGHTITNQMRMPDLKRTKQLAFDLKSILGKQEHCDITLSVGGKKIPVHKAILCARSPVFNMMYQHDMVENQNEEVEIEDIDFDTLQQFVHFLYSADLEDLDVDKAMKLYYAADKYDVEDLRDACSEFLKFSLNVEEACDVLVLSDRHKDEELKSAVRFFMQMHGASIKNTDSWKRLLKSNPKLALEILE